MSGKILGLSSNLGKLLPSFFHIWDLRAFQMFSSVTNWSLSWRHSLNSLSPMSFQSSLSTSFMLSPVPSHHGARWISPTLSRGAYEWGKLTCKLHQHQGKFASEVHILSQPDAPKLDRQYCINLSSLLCIDPIETKSRATCQPSSIFYSFSYSLGWPSETSPSQGDISEKSLNRGFWKISSKF